MSREVPNVRTWSKTVPSYRFDLADLDAYVLKEQAAVIAAMGRERRTDRRELADLAVVVLLVLAPLGGFFAWGGRLTSGVDSDGLGPSAAVAFAGWCFVVALPGPVLVAWRWWRRERHRNTLEIVGLVVSFAAGLAALGSMSTEGGVDVVGFDLPAVPVWLDVVGRWWWGYWSP